MLTINTLNINLTPSPFVTALVRAAMESTTSAGETAPEKTTPPKIGEVWPGQGGVYVGITHEAGKPDRHLILAATVPEIKMDWKRGNEWAASLDIEGHTDFAIPSRFESALIYANLADVIEHRDEWHWTGTQCSEDYAWGQGFTSGSQGRSGKKYEARCRAVRSFPV